MRRHCFTLIELMTYCALALGLVGVATKLFHDASMLNRQSTQQAWTNQDLVLIHRAWQNYVHPSQPAQWRVTADGAGFAIGELTARQAANELLLDKAGSDLPDRVRLPDTATIAFAIEQTADERLAVLRIDWRREKLQKDYLESVRLVATGLGRSLNVRPPPASNTEASHAAE